MLELDRVGMIVEARRALQDRRNNGGPLRDAGHRIDLLERLRLLTAELFGDVSADERNLAGAAYEQNLVDVLRPEPLQRHRLVERLARLHDQRHDLLLERRA